MSSGSSLPFHVEGKVAIVTGAGSGINYEFAKLLLAKKCSVVIGDLALRPEAQALVDDHQQGTRALFVKTDVTDWTCLQTLFFETTKEFGTFDIVCPGAGVFEPHWSNFWHPPTGSSTSSSKDPVAGFGHYACLDINVSHPIRATQLALAEYLKPSNGAMKASPTNPKRVVHIASVASQIANLAVPLYVASKHAIDGFVRSLASLEQTVGVRVNGVQPGIVKTPLWLDHPEKMPMLDQRRDIWITPVEVAEAMVKLLEDPEMVGGTMLEVGSEHTRVVPLFGNMGPNGSGHSTSRAKHGSAEVFQWLQQDNWGKVDRSGTEGPDPSPAQRRDPVTEPEGALPGSAMGMQQSAEVDR